MFSMFKNFVQKSSKVLSEPAVQKAAKDSAMHFTIGFTAHLMGDKLAENIKGSCESSERPKLE